MDPASIIGTTSAVLSFITFCVQAVRVGHKIYNSVGDGDETGQNEYAQCKEYCQRFQTTLQRLQKQTDVNGARKPMTKAEISLLQIVSLCDRVGNEMVTLMEKYEFKKQSGLDPPTSIRKRIALKAGVGKHVIKVTLRILWDQDEAKELRSRFNECVLQLNIHLSEVNKYEVLGAIENIAKSTKYLEQETPALRKSVEANLARLDDNSEKLGQRIESIMDKIDSAGSSVDERLDKLAENMDHVTSLHKTMHTVFEISHETLIKINRWRILQAISFPTRLSRQRQISQRRLADETFEWFIREEHMANLDNKNTQGLMTSFRQWLREGAGIFHITGKPGSAKSTLMNFLQEHDDTRAMLRKWKSMAIGPMDSDSTEVLPTDEDRIAIASTFLYNAANTEEEKSIDGVYRTLLYTILDEYRQDLIPAVFKDYWNPWGWRPWLEEQKDLTITSKDLTRAFESVLRESKVSGWRYCLFIDGADEFQDQNIDKGKFANELRRWITEYSETLKLCVSSREERPWIDESFCSDRKRIRIHQYTETDIKRLVEDRVANHDNFRCFGAKEQHEFVMTVVDKAEGVFIWVRHVLDLVVEQLEENQDLDTLYQVLDTLPLQVEAMIDGILGRVQEINKEESDTIFGILLVQEAWSHHLSLSLAHYAMVRDLLKNPNFLQAPPASNGLTEGCLGEPDSAISAQVVRFKKRLHLLFRGLVDIVTSPSSPTHTLDLELPCLSMMGQSLVFAHRSIYEYLRKRHRYDHTRDSSVITIVIRCLTAQVNMGWCFGHGLTSEQFTQNMNQLVERLASIIRDDFGQEGDGPSARAVFARLDGLDSSLISRWLTTSQLVVTSNAPQPRGVYLPSVFHCSCLSGPGPYVEWVLTSRDEATWMGMKQELQSMLLRRLCESLITAITWRDDEDDPRARHAAMIQRLLEAGFDPDSRASQYDETPWRTFLRLSIETWGIFGGDGIWWRTLTALLQSRRHKPEALSWVLLRSHDDFFRFMIHVTMRNGQTGPEDIPNWNDTTESVGHDESVDGGTQSQSDGCDGRREDTIKVYMNDYGKGLYRRLVDEFPDNKATLKDIFYVFGPTDEPEIAADLESIYADYKSDTEQQESMVSRGDIQADLAGSHKLKGGSKLFPAVVESSLFRPLMGSILGAILGASVMYIIMSRVARTGRP